MLCHTCFFLHGIAGGFDHPHPEIFCAKGHWSGIDPSEVEPKKDPWAGCKDYAVPCPYCGGAAKLVDGLAIYPHRPDLKGRLFWLCIPCKAYVGTHEGSKDHKPLGRLANAELREWKKRAHAAFDPIWKTGKMKRQEAYRYLQGLLNMERQPHIGFMDIEQCKRVVFSLTGKMS